MTGRDNWMGWALVAVFTLGLFTVGPAWGDETYFVSWGLTPSFGYYDHPPLMGWLSWLVVEIEDLLGVAIHGTGHRLACVLFGIATALGLIRYIRWRFPEQAPGALVLAFALLPASIFTFVVYFNDTLLSLLVLIFYIATDVALRAGRGRWDMVVLAGLAFGAALLTKYIAGLFWIALVVWLLTSGQGRRYLVTRFAVTSVIAGVIFAPNLWWNLHHCNVNLAFNFAYREMEAGWRGLPLFLVQILPVFGPALALLVPALWRAGRARRLGYWGGLFVAIMVLTALISLSRGTFRMNWGIPYVLFAAMAGAEVIAPARLGRLIRWNAIYLVVILGPLIALFAADRAGLDPAGALMDARGQAQWSLEMDLADGSLLPPLEAFAREGRVLVTPYYGTTASLRVAGLDESFTASSWIFGRNDDLFLDLRDFDGRQIAWVTDRPERDARLAETVFSSWDMVEIEGRRGRHALILGEGFDAGAYIGAMIDPVIARTYGAHPFGALACDMERYRDN